MQRAVLLSLILIGLTSTASAHTRLIPHITGAGDNVATTLTLENTQSHKVEIILTPFDADGNVMKAVSLSAEPGIVAFDANDFLPAGATHFTLEDSVVAVTVEIGNQELEASNQLASSWDLDPSIPTQGQFLAVINRGDEAADVWAYQHSAEGRILQAKKIAVDLAPMAKIVAPLADHFSAVKGATYSLASSQYLAVSQLHQRLSRDGSMKVAPGQAAAKSASESTRDERGVWYIKGGTLYDVMEMMGYNIATDRLWQSEIFRRTARGRLAEIFGADLAAQDVQVRSTLYSDEELDGYFADSHPDTQAAVNGYVDGFNRRIAEVNSDFANLMPFEFKVLGIPAVENWTVYDIMSWTALLQRNFSSLSNLGFGQVQNSLDLLSLTNSLDPFRAVHMFTDLTWRNDPDAPTMIPSSSSAKVDRSQEEIDSLIQLLQQNKKQIDLEGLRSLVEQRNEEHARNTELLKKVGGFVKGGSYAWAIAGSKTASGNPTIYSGPQMGFSAPAIVVEGSIESPTLTVSGMTVPGIPAIIIGRTPHHAWSMQVGHTPTWDFYVEPPEAVSLHHVEVVKVAGGEDIQVPVFRSPHGPVVAQEPFILSWKYSGWGKEWRVAEGNLSLARAQSMEEFGEGVANLAVTQHFCYADRDGNIAYWHSGFNPIRPQGEYRLPQGLVNAPLEWEGYHPPVHDANTPQGWYAGWNNKARADQDDHSGTYRYGQWHRAIVLQDLLRAAGDQMTFEEIKDLAVNIAATQAFSSGSGSGGGNLWNPVGAAFANAVHAHPTDERMAALEMMEQWDGHYVAGGPDAWIAGTDIAEAWYLIDAWVRQVAHLTFSDEVGNMGGNRTRFDMLLREINPSATRKNHYRLWQRNFSDPSAPQTMDEIIVAGLDAALAELGPGPWGEGQRGSLFYGNTFGLPIPGTPWGARSTYAHIVEYGSEGPVRIESMFPLGQSGFINVDDTGNPVFDPHFFSMKPLFDAFTPRTFPNFEGNTGEE